MYFELKENRPHGTPENPFSQYHISDVKNTIPGDLPSSNLEEIETIIKAHNQTGPQSEMAR